MSTLRHFLITLLVPTALAGCAASTSDSTSTDTATENLGESKSLQLRATTGEIIDVTYSLSDRVSNSNKPSRSRVLDTFRVALGGLRDGDSARVVYIQKMHTQGQCGVASYDSETDLILDLGPDGKGDVLQGSAIPYVFTPTVRIDGYCFTTTSTPQLAVVVNPGKSNERWLIDPYHASDPNPFVQHNFGLMFAQ